MTRREAMRMIKRGFLFTPDFNLSVEDVNPSLEKLIEFVITLIAKGAKIPKSISLPEILNPNFYRLIQWFSENVSDTNIFSHLILSLSLYFSIT